MDRPSVRWSFDTAGAEPSGDLRGWPGHSALCFACNDMVLIMGNQTLSAIDSGTGEVNWQITRDVEMYLKGIVGSIVILSDSTHTSELIVAYNINSGDQVWEREIEFTQTTLGENHVYLRSKDTVIALDVMTGRQSWCHQTERVDTVYSLSCPRNSVVLSGVFGTKLLNSHTGKLIRQHDTTQTGDIKGSITSNGKIITVDDYIIKRINLMTGEVDWKCSPSKVRPKVRVLSVNEQWALIIAHHLTIIAQEDDPEFHDSDIVYLLSTTSGKSQWIQELGISFSPLESADGLLTDNVAVLYGIRGDYASVQGYDIHSGKLLWESDLASREIYNLGGGSIGICSSGTVHAISAKTGETMWTFTASDSQCGLTVMSDKIILLDKSEKGTVYSLENKPNLQNNTDTNVYNSSTVIDFCKGCGIDLTERSALNFCPKCGRKL